MAKLAAQAKKSQRMKERDLNKSCSMCRMTMKQNGFSSIPGICGKCEKESVSGSEAHPVY